MASLYSAGSRQLKKRAARLLVKSLAIAAGLFVVFGVLAALHRVEGSRMSPFVRDGDLCLFYRLGTLATRDVVLYRTPEGDLAVARIVARPGQVVEVDPEGGYTVDGYLPAEEVPYETYPEPDAGIVYPLALGEGEYFLLNDFRSVTSDSRSFGPVAEEDILGNLLFLLRRRSF